MSMKLKSIGVSAMLLICGLSLLASGKDKAASKPNIVFIMADDMGYGDVSAYNPESKIQTPNMDKLATEGLMFTNVHTPSSLCSPTRYGLLTGRYCWRTRLKTWVLAEFYGDTPLIEEERMTIASLLKSQGYETAVLENGTLEWPGTPKMVARQVTKRRTM